MLTDIIVGVLLAGAVALAIARIIIDRKNGKSSCGGDCSGCPMHLSGQCGKDKK